MSFVLRDVLLRAVDLYGREPAVVCGDVEIGWSELAQRVHRVAAWLSAEGVRHGDRVLVLSGNRFELAEVAFAIAELGAALVPISPVAAGPELRHVWEDADARVGLVAPELAELAAQAGGRWLPFCDAQYERTASEGAVEEPPLAERPDDVVLQLYTSGTTGRPKGVRLTHTAMVVHGVTTFLSQRLTHDDVFLTCTPLTHAAGATRIFSLPTEGVTHVILPRWHPAAFCAEVARRSVTTTVLVPSMIQDLLADPGFDPGALETLRLIVYGAAPTPPGLQAAALARIPSGFLHSYGMSEACTALTVLSPEEHAEGLANPALAERLASVGRPVPGVRVRIVDGDGRVLPPHEAGEIQLRSAKGMVGYWRRPEDDAAIWRDGWLATGDLGYTDEAGYLYIVGRKKEMIISGGLNVYPAEVESALLEHPAVQDAAVVGVAHPRWGETPVAFVVLSGHADDDELREHCRARLARYKIPSTFRRVDALPRGETGKVNRAPLEEMLERS